MREEERGEDLHSLLERSRRLRHAATELRREVARQVDRDVPSEDDEERARRGRAPGNEPGS